MHNETLIKKIPCLWWVLY